MKSAAIALLAGASIGFFSMPGERELVEKRMDQLLLFSDLHQRPLIATFGHVPRPPQSDAFKERKKRIGKALSSPYGLPPWSR